MKRPEPDRLSDLMARAIEGDGAAYEQALVEIARISRAYARARVGDTLADDVVQETLLAVHRARHTYDPARPFGAWLVAILHSRMIDTVRRARRHASHELSLATEEAAAPEPASRGAHDLQWAMLALTAQQRAVIRMLKFEDMRVSEVAQALGLSVSNVKIVAHRGYKTMRKLLLGDK